MDLNTVLQIMPLKKEAESALNKGNFDDAILNAVSFSNKMQASYNSGDLSDAALSAAVSGALFESRICQKCNSPHSAQSAELALTLAEELVERDEDKIENQLLYISAVTQAIQSSADVDFFYHTDNAEDYMDSINQNNPDEKAMQIIELYVKTKNIQSCYNKLFV